jgi:hypothetical protein
MEHSFGVLDGVRSFQDSCSCVSVALLPKVVILPVAWASSGSEVQVKNWGSKTGQRFFCQVCLHSAQGEVYQVWENAKVKVGAAWKVCMQWKVLQGHTWVGDANIRSPPWSSSSGISLSFSYILHYIFDF